MADLSGVWRYDTSEVLAAPAAGYMRSGPAPVSWLAFSTQTWGGADVHADLLALDTADQVSIQEVNDATLASRFQLTAAPVDHSTWVEYAAVPVVTTATGPPRKNEDLLVLGFVTPGSSGTEYVPVEELQRILQITNPSPAQTAAMHRVIATSSRDCDWYLGRAFPAPYPDRVVTATLTRAEDYWKAEQSPYGVLVMGGEAPPVYPPRNSWRRLAQTLLPLKEHFGIA